MKTSYFTGPFAPMCESFVAQKRASGIAYEQQAMLLKMFDNFCKGYDVHDFTITKEIATACCGNAALCGIPLPARAFVILASCHPEIRRETCAIYFYQRGNGIYL